MKFGDFMASLQRGELKQVYLLAGEEHYYIEKAQERILSRLFANPQEQGEAIQKISGAVDSDDLVGLIETAPFFASKNVLLLQDTSLFKDKNEGEEKKAGKDKKLERLLATLADMPEFSYVIFVQNGKADKRRKIYKTIEKNGMVLEAEAIRAWNINDWLQGKLQTINKDMDREAMAYFSGVVSTMQTISLEFLDREFDKLALFTQDRRITRELLEKVFAGLPEVSVFALLDAISERKAKKALQLLRRQLNDGTYFTVILALLTRHVRQLWQAQVLQQQGIRGKALAKPLELNPFIAEKLGRAAMQFPAAVLKRNMLELIDADYFLKTGQAGDEVLEHIVIDLCRGEA
ncbi:MAG: DNA polymerase III subunit delta [Selenomonas ruminantium]|uniref:DNA polymerase III subunit delta n=1 Tax=Selenomonas ruminantium TaxID=971 RepID=A0A927ZN91_SELRU|nr:DNA polymerase III subunit delta [Selenomonas ruminantium]MBE6084237.1 DNA polymerase III subunit delta [Selenomonas ruminantium]